MTGGQGPAGRDQGETTMQLHRTAAVLATVAVTAGMAAGSAHATTGTTTEAG